MKYSLVVKPKAQRQFLRLDRAVQSRLGEAMSALRENPRPHGCLKMKGVDAYRIRIGEYRIVYEIEDEIQFARFGTCP